MNMTVKKIIFSSIPTILFMVFLVGPLDAASPWTKEPNYWAKTKGKLIFGLKNSLLGWLSPWAEDGEPKYKKQWEGFSAGMGGLVVNTTAGLIQLSTFFIPVDFPDVGYGLRIPDPNWKPIMYRTPCKNHSVTLTPAPKVVPEQPAS